MSKPTVKELAEASNIGNFYNEAMRAWEARQKDRVIVLGFRDDLRDIEGWKRYCLAYKPIDYREYIALRVRAMNGEIPWPT